MIRYLRYASWAMLLSVLTSPPGYSGSYAALAAQVQAANGLLLIYADDTLQNDSPSDQDAAAIAACHTIALEGVTVTTVQIIGTDGQTVIHTTGASTLAGC